MTHVRFPDTAAGFAWFLSPVPSRVCFVSEYLRADARRQQPDLFEGRSDVVYDGVAPTRFPTRRGSSCGAPSVCPTIGLSWR